MSGVEYARATGAVVPSPPAPPPQAGEGRKALPPLSEAERERVARNIELVKQYLPEAVPFIKEMHELGLIDGWRSVRVVEVFKKNTRATP